MFAPPILDNPGFINARPGVVLGVWLTLLTLSGAALITALIGLASRALQQHIGEIDSARIIGPIAEYVAGWIALAALGIIAFRLIAAIGELNTERTALISRWNLIAPAARQGTSDQNQVMIFDSPEAILLSIPQANVIVVSSQLVDTMDPQLLAAAVAHEQAHLDGRHGLIRLIGVLALAIAPVFTASTRMAQATRIATELIADDAAATTYGRTTVADALEQAFPVSSLIEERVSRLRS